ncbi:type II toxin-antitoxin system PemK/MazF family toxin [Candidatus Micrarchaeota archaeon]|nr:type II toxin-antitoxin system PemK/MazF family toxin [Candidatus Micrarchaeota archaeon]
MSYSNFEQGDIVLLDFKFSDFEGSKLRPALVMSPGSYNISSADMIVLKVTSVRRGGVFELALAQSDLSEGVLKAASVVRVDFPLVVEKRLAGRKVGKAKEEFISRVKKLTAKLYALG